MIKAIYRDGVIHPVDPVPPDWTDGQQLHIQQVPANGASNQLRMQFETLSAQWKEESRYLSSTSEIAANPAYQRIIGMGMPVVPLILKDLRKEPHHWFWALQAITGEDPVPDSMRGRVREMAETWINWGVEERLIEGDESGQ